MREIKFRAWHLGYSKKGHTMLIEPKMLFDNEPGDCLRWFSDGQKISDIMQYTGLKDKNGKEIYEGDILRDLGGFHHKIEWQYYFAQFQTVCVELGDAQDISKDALEEVFEVVGNIYEDRQEPNNA